jgi:hypothetical protein
MGAAVKRIGGGVEPYFGRRRRRLTGVENFCPNLCEILFVKILSLGPS